MVASIPPRADMAELFSKLSAARREVGQMASETRVARAQSQLEALMQAVRTARASGDEQRALALAGEAGRIGRDLVRRGDPAPGGTVAETLRLAHRIEALATGHPEDGEGGSGVTV